MILKKENLPWFTTAAVIIIFAVLMVLQKCSSDRNLADTLDQITRLKDTVIVYREVDGKVISDSKGAELTLESYMAADAQRYASFERMMRSNNSEMLTTVALLVSRPAITGNAPVTVNPVNKSMTIDMTDSCSLIGNVTVDSTGKATKNIQFRQDSIDLVVYRDREKWYLGKEITASGIVRNNCGKITGQKAVVITSGKKKVHQTNLFKTGAIIILFEGLKFAITGKL